MTEIDVNAALAMKYALIDLNTPVKDYEKYDFHAGTKCKINGFPFQLMAENGKLSFEAEAICLSAHIHKTENRIEFKADETIAILCIKDGKMRAYEFTIPGRLTQQSFIVS